MKNIQHNIVIVTLLIALGVPYFASAQESKVKIYGNVYGGGELAQVVSTDTTTQLIQDADLATLFTTHADHVYTTYVHLGTGAEVYGRVFGGGKGDEDSFDGEGVRIENPAGKVIGQTDVALDGATVWSEIYGGGEMADVYGNTLVHFKKGKAGHNAFGGGLGVLGKRDGENNLVPLDSEDTLPDNRYEPLASADIKVLDEVTTKITGESFVVFDGTEDSYTHYEFKKARTINRDGDGKPTLVDGLYYTETDQFNPGNPEKLFSINHNIYGGGMTASKVEGKTFVHINYGMVNEDMMNFEHEGQKVWSMIYNSIANAQFCVFGGGYGYHTDIMGDANVTMDVQGSGQYKYIEEFTKWFAGPGKEKYHWDTNVGDPEAIYAAADESTWSHGAPGRSCMDIIGGGYNGKVQGTTNVTVGGDVVLRKVYGGGYYSSVGNTNVTIKSGIFNRVYGGGLIGNVYGKATLTLGQQGTSQSVHDQNLHLLVKDAVYGGNDVSGTVGTSDPVEVRPAGVPYNVYDPVDDDDHGVRLNMYGGLVLGDVYGAGNGNHPGYGNPNYMQFGYSQHPSENYRKVIVEGETAITSTSFAHVYKYRPRVGRVVMNLQGNAGEKLDDDPQVDKVRIWGRTFGGGNSCNVGIWDGTQDDNAEVYATDGSSWHPGDNFQGEGSIYMNIGSHVQLGNRNDSHTTPNGLFMGSNGEHMITQHLDPEKARYYHQYYDTKAKKYYPGFVVYEDDAVTPIKRSAGLKAFTAFINNILTKTDNVHLNVANDAQDVWMSNFVGGGYRGSMQAQTKNGQFHYTLPRGVTVGHDIVGGAFNAHIIYRVYATDYGAGTYKTDANGNYMYETIEPQQGVLSKAEAEEQGLDEYDYIKKLYADGHEGDEAYKTGYLRYNYDGGILAHDNSGSRNGKVFTAYGSDDNVVDFSGEDAEHGLRKHKDKALVYVDARCQLNPDTINGHVHGGNVFGGCFESGIVDGDIWIDYRCYIAPRWYGNQNFNGGPQMFANAADYQNHFSMMAFGAGYGKNTSVMGATYLRVLYNKENGQATYPCLYNVFGGSYQGTVAGNTNIYYNAGQQGLCVGGIYGGGSQGYVAGKSFVELAGGYITDVYGGAREANVGRGTHVWAYDGALRNWADDLAEHDDAPLVVERIFGGSDVSGLIGYTADATNVEDDAKRIDGAGWTAYFSTSNWPEELFNNRTDDREGLKRFDSYIQVGGTAHGTRGYPLIGQIYAGGNGENTDTEHGHVLPGIHTALIELNDGMVMEAFGGGNAATIYEQNYILTNGQYAPVSAITMPNPLLTQILQQRVLRYVPDCYTLSDNTFTFKPNNLQRLFGGNNVAEMAIQPKWNLKAGHLGSVYAGGNMGNMTYYNPAGLAATAGQLNPTPKGLSIHVESNSIEINELYGGCRMADVVAINYTDDGEGNITADTVSMGDDYYGATVNISGGTIHTVYGGNDVAGHVYNGSNVNITGAINGDVYGSGNGDYIYQYDATKEAPKAGQIAVRMHPDGYPYYAFRGTNAKAGDAEKLQAINAIRPNVDKAYLNIAGTNEHLAYVTGAVYCGGNASTIAGTNAYTKFDIGSNCVLNGVYMGSNGEQLAVTTSIDRLSKVNGMNLNTAALLKEYMNAVAMDALPRDFSIADTLTDAYIGTFCLGGNRGSMISAEPLHITIPSSVTIYNKVVGGCNNAYLSYGGNATTGGFITWNQDKTQPKIVLDIYAKFLPRVMYVPEFQDANGQSETEEQFRTRFNNYKAQKFLYVPVENPTKTTKRLNGKYCNVYGGCYTRGYVYGDVEINMYSDMLGDFLQADGSELYYNAKGNVKQFTAEDKQTVLTNNIKLNETSGRPVFSVFGGGYGSSTVIYGNTMVRMLNNHNTIGAAARDGAKPALVHPSANALYGGGESGKMIGTSTIHVADGTVYSNVVGGALAGNIYGNTEILVGYPSYYEVQKTGEYKLKRSNFTSAELAYVDGSNRPAVKQSIFLTKGDRINAAIYQAIRDWDTDHSTAQASALTLMQNQVQKDWDSIAINIRGGIYGGGYSRANVEDGETAMATTVLKFTSSYNLSNAHPEYWTAANTLDGQAISKTGEYVYGGNATIWVQDQVNAQNWGSIPTKKEHITITTETDAEAHTGAGGIFGDGHSSLVAAFRSSAVEGYGYAEHPANNPKLLNTFQRFDILQIRDCAMKMYGQIDVATGQNDHTLYSVSRISELMLNSHINDSTANLKATSELNSRNVIDFYNPVHFLGSITSEVTFKPLANGGSKYHDVKGNLVETRSYYDYKNDSIRLNYDYGTNGIHTAKGCKEAFGKRNAGTAKNMIRIDDPDGRGMHLKVVQENNYAVNAQGVREEQSFYGPLSGVFEFELTHVNARGGGYVYSNNLHQQTIAQSVATYPGTKTETESFLQTSGNVFFVPVHLADRNQDRYVYDDCHPIPFSDRGDGQLEKAHYWFVEGDGPTWCSYPQEPTKIKGDTITIETAEQLAWVYDYIDHCYDSKKASPSDKDVYPGGFEGWTIQLGNDINLEQLTILDQREVRMIWCPIADQKDTYFKGTFDGNGHKIDGMLLDVDFITTLNTYGIDQNYASGYDHYFGLFAKTKNAIVKNVELTAALVRNAGGNDDEMVHIGTLITQVDSTEVLECSVELTDSILSNKTNELQAAAAFICHTDGKPSTIHRNFVTGTIEANAAQITAPISGFISRLDNGSTMEHCYSLVDVHAQQVAGLADMVQGNAVLEHSYYAGTLTRTDANTNWGAILANAGAAATVKHCYYDSSKNPTAGGYRGGDTQVFSSKSHDDHVYSSWSTYGLPTDEMISATSGDVWRSCYSHDGHSAENEAEEYRCQLDADDGELVAQESAWNKGVWTYLPGFYPFLKSQELDCSALTTAFAMPTAASFDMTTRTDLVGDDLNKRWLFIDQHFQLPAYGKMTWSVANNTLLLDSVSNKAQNKVNAHLYLGGPDVLSINCDDIHRQMQDIYVTREEINSPQDKVWYDALTSPARVALGAQLYTDSLALGMLRHKEVTNISKKNGKGVYEENGFDGDLHIWNRDGDAGTVTNPRHYKVNGTITYYTGYTNPYLWHEVNIPYTVDSASVYRTKSGNEYRISARNAELAEDADGGNFWLRSFANDADIQFGGSVFQQGWIDPAEDENIGHRPSVLRFPQLMKVGEDTYLAGDYWCYNQENNIDGTAYHNGGSEIRFYSTPGNTVYGTQDWDGNENENHRGIADGYNFHVYGNPTLGNIQLEGYYWMLESDKRDTTGVSDSNVKPEFETQVAQWFSLQQDPVVKPLGIWIDGPEGFKQQALDEGSSAPLRLTPMHEQGANEQFREHEASFTASGFHGLLGVFSYVDQIIRVYNTTGSLLFSQPVRANTGFTLNLPTSLFVVSGSESDRQVKVML